MLLSRCEGGAGIRLPGGAHEHADTAATAADAPNAVVAAQLALPHRPAAPLPAAHLRASEIARRRLSEHDPRLVRDALDVVPDLVVEVRSPATQINHLGAVKDTYLAAGAVLADPQAATITRSQQRKDDRQQSPGRGDELPSPLLPGLVLEVAHVFLNSTDAHASAALG